MDQILISVPEAANVLGISERKLYLMMADKKLPGVKKVGRRTLLNYRKLQEWADREEEE